eukprot:1735472-Prymnesium_polylepis.1
MRRPTAYGRDALSLKCEGVRSAHRSAKRTKCENRNPKSTRGQATTVRTATALQATAVYQPARRLREGRVKSEE